MALALLDVILIALVTALSAFPAVLFSLWALMRSDRVKEMLADQLMNLPAALNDPKVRYSVKQAVDGLIPELRTGLSAAIAKSVQEEMEAKVMLAVNTQLAAAGDKLTATLKGSLGAYTKNLASQMIPGPDGSALKDGPLAGIAQGLGLLRSFRGPPPSGGASPPSMHL